MYVKTSLIFSIVPKTFGFTCRSVVLYFCVPFYKTRGVLGGNWELERIVDDLKNLLNRHVK